MNDLLAAHRHISDNRAEVEASSVCGCIQCLELFEPSEIVAYGGLDMADFADPQALARGTAICPRCGSESVIGDKSGYEINPNFLNRMHQAWCQQTIVRRPKPKA